jgi:hypothetical protein
LPIRFGDARAAILANRATKNFFKKSFAFFALFAVKFMRDGSKRFFRKWQFHP